MIKLTALFFIIIAPTLAGILITAILATPQLGLGNPMSLLMVSAGAFVVALPISYIIAGMVNRAIGS